MKNILIIILLFSFTCGIYSQVIIGLETAGIGTDINIKENVFSSFCEENNIVQDTYFSLSLELIKLHVIFPHSKKISLDLNAGVVYSIYSDMKQKEERNIEQVNLLTTRNNIGIGFIYKPFIRNPYKLQPFISSSINRAFYTQSLSFISKENSSSNRKIEKDKHLNGYYAEVECGYFFPIGKKTNYKLSLVTDYDIKNMRMSFFLNFLNLYF